MRAHTSGRVTSFLTMKEMQCAGVSSYILQATMWAMQCVLSSRKTYPCQQLQIPDHRVPHRHEFRITQCEILYFWPAAGPKLNGTPPPYVDCTCCNRHGAERSWLRCRSRCGSGLGGGGARSLSGILRTTISLSAAYQLNSLSSYTYVAQLVVTFLISFQFPTTV
jgi:hypothetical protein